MSRLVTFGCSHTFGSCLEDVHPRYTGDPSKFAWPQVLADKLGFTCTNLAITGAGNKELTNKIINELFLPDDTIIIMWSYFTRYDFFQFTPQGGYRAKLIDANYKILVEKMDVSTVEWKYSNAVQNYLTIEFVHQYLAKQKLIFYSLFSVDDFFNFERPKFLDSTKIIDIPMTEFEIDKAKDRRHFGQKSHELLALKLYNKLHELR